MSFINHVDESNGPRPGIVKTFLWSLLFDLTKNATSVIPSRQAVWMLILLEGKPTNESIDLTFLCGEKLSN